MAHHESAKKQMRQGVKRRARNRMNVSLVKTELKKLREATEDVGEIAAVRFELARALWDVRPDERPRAVALATQAQEGLPRERQADVAQWLTAHPVPDAGVR